MGEDGYSDLAAAVTYDSGGAASCVDLADRGKLLNELARRGYGLTAEQIGIPPAGKNRLWICSVWIGTGKPVEFRNFDCLPLLDS